jgi:hypothetical protein
MKNILIILFITLLVACESPPVRRAELIDQHPEWSPEMVKIIREGYIIKGMTTDQVRAAWGYPCWSCTGTTHYPSSSVWRAWEYPTQVVFFDKQGKVTHWTKK